MAACPSPITAENFRSAWKCIARKRRRSIKKELIRRVSVTLAQILYFFVFLVLAIGIFYEMCGPLVRSYIDVVPQVGIWWGQLRAAVLDGAANEAGRILRCAGMLYLLPFGAVLPFVVLIVALYHPRAPKRTGDLKQDAWQLRSLAKHAQVYAQRKENNTAAVCATFVGVLMAVFVLGLMLYAHANPDLRDEVVAQAHQANLRCFLYGAALYICYRIANIPLRLMLWPLHFCHVPATMVTDTESYYDQLSRSETAAEQNDGPVAQ